MGARVLRIYGDRTLLQNRCITGRWKRCVYHRERERKEWHTTYLFASFYVVSQPANCKNGWDVGRSLKALSGEVGMVVGWWLGGGPGIRR